MKIPTYDTLQVGVAQTPNMRIDAPEPDQFLTGVKQSMALGQTADKALSMLGRIQQQEQDKLDTAAVMEYQNRLAAYENDSLYGEGGYLTRKGKNAVGVVKEGQQAYTEFAAKLVDEMKLDDRQKLAARQLSVRRQQALGSALGRHELEQRNAYLTNQADASLALDAENARRVAGNPDALQLLMGNSRATIEATAASLGSPPEQVQQAWLTQQSRIHSSVLDSLVEKDPKQAQAYLDQHRDELTGQDVAAAERVIQPALRKAEAIDAAEIAYRTSSITADGVFKTMIGQESKGAQFDKSGKPLTSPKGAIGVAQVMPGTAPEAARLAGLPWDENRYKTDPAYNLQLGRAYYNAQVQKYGDPVVAAAAYNAGPGAVDKWLKKYGDPSKGQIGVAEWAAKIPYKETRDYVAGILRDGMAGGAERSPALARAALQSIPDPETRRMAETLLNQRLQLDKEAQTEQYANDLDTATAIVQQSGSFANVPPKLWAKLKPADQAALQAGPRKSSDPNTLAGFMFQPETITVQNVQAARPNLAESDYRQLMETARSPQRDDKVIDATFDNDMFKLGVAQAGLAFNSKDADQAKQELDLRMKFKQMIDQEQRQKKRTLSMDEKQGLLNMLLKPVKVKAIETGFFGGTTDTTMDKRFYEVQNQQNVIIPPDMRTRIVSDFTKRGIRPTPQNILSAYLALKE